MRGFDSGVRRAADPLDLEGTQVGQYVVEKHLGGGGMGVVYRARDRELGRQVALKFLPPHLRAHEEAEKRFAREARAASALEHPHIATIYEIGRTEEGCRFIAMAYYEGETLKEKIGREGPLPIEEVLGYGEQVAEALARAHEAGIVHRDVKPANVMVTGRGDVKLLDFGIARVAQETRLTRPGQQPGTAAYMSPEQVEGEAIDHRTDLWALGALLYEMLAGERPFQGERKTTLHRAILHEEPTPLGERREEVPTEVKRLVERCLQKDPADRFQCAGVLRKALGTPEKKPGDRTPPSPSSKETWKQAGGLVALVLLTVVGGYWWLNRGGASPPTTRLSVTTEPSGAIVSLEGRTVGGAPVTDTIKGRAVPIRVQRAGYVPVTDTVTGLANRRQVELDVRLPLRPTPLAVRTDPTEANVYLGDELIGQSPLASYTVTDSLVQRHGGEGLVPLRIRKEGYRPKDTLVHVARAEQVRLRLSLQREAEPSPAEESSTGEEDRSTAHGSLMLRAVPSGTAVVDGQARERGKPLRIAAGTHRVRFEHPTYGSVDTTLTVEAGEADTLTCYFKHWVEVRTGLSEPWAQVYVDGKNTGEPTSYRKMLNAGKTYQIGARIQSRPPEVTGGTYRRRGNESGRLMESTPISGNTKAVTLRPSFERETHMLDFEVSKPGS